MFKKMMYVMAAGAMMLATSCEKDGGLNSGDAATVAIGVATPQIATRAYSDGLTATQLQYAVYDKAGNYLPKVSGTTTLENLGTTVELTLTTGNTYDVLFWAAAEDAPYEFDAEAKTVTVDYDDAESNAENRDAFFARKTFTVTGKQTETVELTRPFAQLNIGTADYQESADAGYVPTFSKVEVTAYETLNLWDGEVSNPAVRTFDFAAIARNEQFPVGGYEYLAMNYLLVGAAKELVEVKFTYEDDDVNPSYVHERVVGAVPVQRNYRTNIFGNLLTSDVDVNVTINPAYEIPDYNFFYDDEVTVKNEDQLNLALASPVCKTIILGNDIELQSATGNTITRDVVIDMNGFCIKADRNYVKNMTVQDITTLVVDNGAKVEFIGEGSIINTAAEGAYAIAVWGGADVTIAGNVSTSAYYDAIYVREGSLTVCGGVHRALEDTNPEKTSNADWNGVYDYCHLSTVVNCEDVAYQNEKAVVALKGGTYVNMDPSDIHEGKMHHQSFVAEGYKVESEAQANGDVWFTVVAE